MNRREFLKLLGISIPAITLVKPGMAETVVTEKPIATKVKPAYWTATKGTLSTASTTCSRVWLDGNKVVYYPHPWKAAYKNIGCDRNSNPWSIYSEVK